MSATTAHLLLSYARELRDRPVFLAALTVSIAAVWISAAQIMGAVI